LIMIIYLGLAVFNTGIEFGFWTGLDGCSSNTELVTQTSALLNSLGNEAVIRCDEPVWTLFGISMAGYNALLSLDALILFYLMDKK
ncbi:MAG: disulfide bond formation protein B, partial [Alphaproteobacteria bacterium]|nr:disulfide bond formation protein B [Alphaproteobacteria bacterium]